MRGRAVRSSRQPNPAVTYFVAGVMLASVLLVLVTVWLVGASGKDFLPVTTAALKSDRL